MGRNKRCAFDRERECTAECKAFDGPACMRMDNVADNTEAVREVSEAIASVARALSGIYDAITTPEAGNALEGLAALAYCSPEDGLSQVADAIQSLRGDES